MRRAEWHTALWGALFTLPALMLALGVAAAATEADVVDTTVVDVSTGDEAPR